MIWLIFGLLILLIICFIRFQMYRKQVRALENDLKFIREHDSNLRVTQDVRCPEINQLVIQINQLITTHKVLEEEIVHKEYALKSLITYLSHDIRTPLTSLDGYFELLKNCDNEDDRERYSQIISGRIHTLKDLLEQLFLYMKLQNDSYEMETTKCNVTKLLYNSMFAFYQDFTNRGMEPELNIPEFDLYVMANETGLSRVFQNVIKNVLEHGKDRFTLTATLNRKELWIEFRNIFDDNNPIDITQVFERFYKADQARTHTSTGLGLAIAKELVEKMGGTIAASSKDNEFMITIKINIIE